MRRTCILMAVVVTLGCVGCRRTRREAVEEAPAPPLPPPSASADTAPGKGWPGRLHRLPPWDEGTPGLLINLPPQYEAGTRKGPDFDVHLLCRPPTVADPASATVGIYVGHHPRPLRSQALAQPGRAAGRDVTWYGDSWEENGQTVYHAETQLRGLFPAAARPDLGGLIVHLFIWGTDQQQIEALMAACESLRLDRTGSPPPAE